MKLHVVSNYFKLRLLHYIYCNKHFKKKKASHYTCTLCHNSQLSTVTTFPCHQGWRPGEVQLQSSFLFATYHLLTEVKVIRRKVWPRFWCNDLASDSKTQFVWQQNNFCLYKVEIYGKFDHLNLKIYIFITPDHYKKVMLSQQPIRAHILL